MRFVIELLCLLHFAIFAQTKSSRNVQSLFTPGSSVQDTASLVTRREKIQDYTKQDASGSDNLLMYDEERRESVRFSDNNEKEFFSVPKIPNNNILSTKMGPKLSQEDKNMIETSLENPFSPSSSNIYTKLKTTLNRPTFVQENIQKKFIHQPILFHGKLLNNREKRSSLSELFKQIGFPSYGAYPQSVAGSSLYGSYANAQSGQGGLQQPVLAEPIEGEGEERPIEHEV